MDDQIIDRAVVFEMVTERLVDFAAFVAAKSTPGSMHGQLAGLPAT